ncbi:MAG TPA: transketolase [Micropepsaceae bacterium]|nr:transketolase [Micropepsaceae bacterium]
MDGPKSNSIDQLAINTIRTLSMDAVQAANSGHPGTPMGLAPVAYTLWQRVLKFNPDNVAWPNRDRFVLSAGHASMLLYSLLHLTGVKAGNGEAAVTLDDIRHFRQIGSHCPGHPEYRHTAGVETTTGPLGQGCSNSVGMAIAARYLANHFNRPEFALFDYDVYALCSDGDMMEGVASEAASIAGHLALGNLCWLYDNNNISIEGHTSLAFTEDVGARFRAYGWNVEHVRDANDCDALFAALGGFRQNRKAPTLIIVDSHIAYGAPHKQDTKEAHGEPLGEPEVKLAKQFYGWPEDAKFLVPDGVREHFDAQFGARGRKLSADWYAGLKTYRQHYPDLGQELDRIGSDELPKNWDSDVAEFPADAKGMATREASGKVLNAIAPHIPWLLGGSGDLAPSTKTLIAGAGDFEGGNTGRNLHFGVREHAMGAISNGLALSKLRPYCATFLIFSDYMRPSIRLAAMMELPVVYVFTHDSIGLGEDGPTHQPIEQLPSLRAMPGLVTMRPADANEVREAWLYAMQSKRPTALSLSRQGLPVLDRKTYAPASGLRRGAYVLADAEKGTPDVILIASGSEVPLCIEARDRLAKDGIRARVISMPSWELFEEQEPAYRNQVLPPNVRARVSVEAASPFGWDRYVGPDGARIGITTFGASGPYKEVYRHFGITTEHIVEAAKEQAARNKGG